MRILTSFSLVVALATASCASSYASFVPMNTPPRALVPHSPADVHVLTAGAPAAEHVDVGLIEIDRAGPRPDEATQLRELRDEAAKVGCDAVVAAYRGRDAELYGTCIVYTRAAGVSARS